MECWNWKCGERGHHANDCWTKKNTNKGGSKEKHEAKNATDAHNLDSSKPADVEAEVEVGGCGMNSLDADAVDVRESEWIKTAWPQSVTDGRTIPGDSDMTVKTGK